MHTVQQYDDIKDEYHIVLICKNFRDVRLKYIKPFYYKKPSMFKFVELVNTTNKRDRFKLMLFLKLFLTYMAKRYELFSLISCVFVFTFIHIFRHYYFLNGNILEHSD